MSLLDISGALVKYILRRRKEREREGEKKIKKEGLQIKSGGSLADFRSHARAPAPCRNFVPDYKYPSVV